MNVSLTPQLEKLVQKKVASGRYNSASEVVREALRLLEDKDRLRTLRFKQMKEQASAGLSALDAGDYIELDEQGMKQYLNDVNQRGRQRRSKKKTASK